VGALVVSLAVVAAGCGQSSGPGAGGDDQVEIRTLADTTEAAGTARFEGSYQSPGNGSPGSRFEGEIDFAKQSWVTRSTHHVDGRTGSDVSESRVVDGYTYLQVPVPTGDEDEVVGRPATPWYRIRVPTAGVAMMPMGTSGDVTGYLGVLESLGARLETLGADTVRGTPTTRYRISPGEPPNVPAQVRALGEFTSDGSDAGTMELWVDDAVRIRRLRTDYCEGDGGGRSEVELFDFGAPVSIEAPPLDQVTTQSLTSVDPGTYEEVASGGSEGPGWKLFASMSDDTQCLAVEADVPKYVAAVLGADDGRVGLGCSSSAVGVAGPVGDPNGVVETHSVSIEPKAVPLADGRALLVSNAPEGATAVTLRLRDGGQRQVPITGGYVGAVLAQDEVAETIVFDTGSGTKRCRLEAGIGYDCEGSVTDSSGASGSSSSSSSLGTTGAVYATTSTTSR
jgi:hypothetical protein